jgi:hypothetical protein
MSPQATFTIRRKSSRDLIIYDPGASTLTLLKADNAMGVRYP